MIDLNAREKELLDKSMTDIITQLEQSLVREAELRLKRAEYQELEDFNFKLWSYYNSIIVSYEKAIQNTVGTYTGPNSSGSGKGGEYILNPFVNQDVVNLANNTGRLYQGTVSNTAKVIPEMVGGGLAPSLGAHELDYNSWIQTLISLSTSGTQNGAYSGTTTTYSPLLGYGGGRAVTGYNGTQMAVNFGGAGRCPIGWVLVGGNTLLYISSFTDYTTGSAPAVYTATICNISNYVNNQTYGTGVSVTNWNGYPSANRGTHITDGSTSQTLMNAMLYNSVPVVVNGKNTYPNPAANSLRYNLERWLSFVNEVVQAQKDNPSPTMVPADKQAALDLQTYLNGFIPTMTITNAGITSLQAQITNRINVTGPATIQNSKKQKELFYAPRISYTNMRADIQNGSLTTVLYIDIQLSHYPDPWLAQVRDSLWILKNELST